MSSNSFVAKLCFPFERLWGKFLEVLGLSQDLPTKLMLIPEKNIWKFLDYKYVVWSFHRKWFNYSNIPLYQTDFLCLSDYVTTWKVRKWYFRLTCLVQYDLKAPSIGWEASRNNLPILTVLKSSSPSSMAISMTSFRLSVKRRFTSVSSSTLRKIEESWNNSMRKITIVTSLLCICYKKFHIQVARGNVPKIKYD